MHDIILFLVGIVVGAMNAVAGGGILLGFPVMLAVGLSPLIANVTANIVVLPGNLASAFGYRRLLKKVPRRYLLLIIPTIIGATIGALILRHTSSTSFEKIIPTLIIIAVALFAFQPYLYLQLHRHLHGPKYLRKRLKPLVIVGIALLPLAIYGGYFGAGFGFITLAFLGFTKLHNHVHRMNALKNIITVCVATTSIACLLTAHLIDWHHGLVMGAGNFIGGYGGAVGSQKVSSHTLRMIVVAIGICTAAYLALRPY